MIPHDPLAGATAQKGEFIGRMIVEGDPGQPEVVLHAAGGLALPRHIEATWRWSWCGHALIRKHRKDDTIPPEKQVAAGHGSVLAVKVAPESPRSGRIQSAGVEDVATLKRRTL